MSKASDAASKSAESGAGAGSTTTAGATPAAAAPAKKKSTPKARKRKASDAGVAAKTGVSPAKKSASDSSTSASAGGAGGSAAGGGSSLGGAGAGASAAGSHPAGTAGNTDGLPKPFIKGELAESIKHMMFGFGDEAEPLDETAELMEDMVVEYIHATTKKAMDLAQIKGKLDTECFIFLLRKDPERYERIAELLRANDELRAVLNSGFDPSDEKLY